MRFTLSLLAGLLLASVGESVKIKQKCDIAMDVRCPTEPNKYPSVSCSTVACTTTTKNTWFIGSLYKRVDCLEPFGKMVKVEYQKQGELSCTLVPLQSNSELLDAYLNPNCESAVPATEAPTTAAPTTPAPTTEAPTTPAPTTAVPTTPAPTTAVPTTPAPTTAVPTTPAPTTAVPTTPAPTTAVPTTPAATTEAPTTPAPTTETPSTPAPTTVPNNGLYTVVPTTPPTTIPPCPEGWTPFGSSCFFVSDVYGSYGDGYTYCTNRGGNLASIRSQKEQDFVEAMLPGSVWIGYSDGFTEGSFFWADSSTSTYTNFYPNEPSGYANNKDEDCVEMRVNFNYAWNDEWCNTQNRYLCRLDL